MESAPSFRQQYETFLAQRAKDPPRRATAFPERPLAWMALAPSWPAPLVGGDFPGDRALLDLVVAAGQAHLGPSRPPYEGDIYWMDDAQRSLALRTLAGSRDDATAFFLSELRGAAVTMEEQARTEGIELSPPLRRWAQLAHCPDRRRDDPPLIAMAKELDDVVTGALNAAREASAVVAPEVRRWISTLEPLVLAFDGPLEVSLARTRRRLELFHHRSRDEQYLKNYEPRLEPERALRDLLFDGDDAAWALHLVGDGGMGKTMLLRRIKAQLASAWGLATAGVDFDHLHRDYPTRAPGLLLSGLAEELRLWDDKNVENTFSEFDNAILIVDNTIARRLSDPQGLAGDRGRLPPRPLRLFVDALKLIAQTDVSPEVLHRRKTLYDAPPANLSGKVRPLLILDTCEELARIRVDGTLPDNVDATFDVLEKIHLAVPSLRVIFAGRRPLAQRGHGGWEFAGCRLPERKWLRRFDVRGFTRAEALGFLDHFHQQNRGVRPDLRELILSFSVASEPGSDPSDRTRYNPYDLDMFAELVCGDPAIDSARLRDTPRTIYVRERIINAASSLILPFLPLAAELGRFDRDLLADLLGGRDASSETVIEEVISQEWIETVPNSRRNGPVWAIQGILRGRLREYYWGEERAAAAAACELIRNVLPDLLLDPERRPWAALIPEYFEVALEALRPDPVLARQWWAKVEARIVRDGQWEWARELTDLLLADEPPHDDQPGADLLHASIVATQAVAAIHLGLPDRVEESWVTVLELAGRHADPAEADGIIHRAWAGRLAGRRWAVDPATSLVDIENWLNQPPATELATAEQAVAELAGLENVVELLDFCEQSELADPDDVGWPGAHAYHDVRISVLGRVQKWAGALKSSPLPAGPKAFLGGLLGRIARLSNNYDEAAVSLGRAVESAELAERTGNWADWQPPDDLPARLGLEFLRALYAVQLGPAELLGHRAVDSSRTRTRDVPPASIDADRLTAAFLVLEGHVGLPHEVPAASVEASSRLSATPRCQAHLAFPPLRIAAREAQAARGEIEAAVMALEADIKSESLPAYFRPEAERALLRIAIRSRLLDQRVGWSSRLAADWLQSDQKLLLTAAALGLPLDVPSKPGAGHDEGQSSQELESNRQALDHLNWRAGRLRRPKGLPIAGSADTYLYLSQRLDRVEAALVGRERIPDFWYFISDLDDHLTKSSIHELLARVPVVKRLVLLLRLYALSGSADFAPTHSDLVLRVGSRRAAELAFEEGSLLGLRLPDQAVHLLEVARDWSGTGPNPDPLGAFRVSIATALLLTRRKDASELDKCLTEIRQRFDACLSLRPDLAEGLESFGTPPGTDVPRLLLSGRASGTGGPEMVSWWGWHPWLVRWFSVLARSSGDSPPRSELRPVRRFSLHRLALMAPGPELRRVRRFYYDQRQTVPPDLYQALGESRFWLALDRAWEYLASGLLFMASVSTFICMVGWVVCLVIWPFHLKSDSHPFGLYALYLFGGFMVSAFVGALLSEHLERRRAHKPNRVEEHPQVAAAPVVATSTALGHSILTVEAKTGRAALVRIASHEANPTDELIGTEDYVSRARKLYDGGFIDLRYPAPETKGEPARIEPRDVILLLGEKSTAIQPWEAIIALKDVATEGPLRMDLRFIRRLATLATKGPDKPFVAPIEVITWTSSRDVQATSWSRLAWSGLNRGDSESHRGPLYRHQAGPIVSSDVTRRGVGLLHMVGTFRATYGGGGGSGIDLGDSSTPSVIGPEEIARRFPDLRLCVLQGTPDDDSRRSLNTRDAAERSRLLAAELAGLGVPAVIVLPSLPVMIGVEAIQLIAGVLANADNPARARARFLKILLAVFDLWQTIPPDGPTQPRDRLVWVIDKYWRPERAGPWLLAEGVRKVQELIAERGQTDRTSAVEAAFDVCFHSTELLNLQVVREQEEASRPASRQGPATDPRAH